MQKSLQQPRKNPTRTGLILARESRRWTQQRLADEIGSTFVSISRWETGARMPSPYFRRKLCLVFNKTEAELDLVPPEVEIEAQAIPALELSPPTQQTMVLHQPWWRTRSTLTTGSLTLLAFIAAGIAWRAPFRNNTW